MKANFVRIKQYYLVRMLEIFLLQVAILRAPTNKVATAYPQSSLICYLREY
jgi:hypothetical protein